MRLKHSTTSTSTIRSNRKSKKIRKVKAMKHSDVKKEVGHVPIPRFRNTAGDTSGPRPYYWPSQVNKNLDELYKPSQNLFRSLEGEREEHLLFRKDYQERPWTLLELAIDALQMPLLLEGKAKEYYHSIKDLPPVIDDKIQQILPTDVDIPRAIEVIDDGFFWKRLTIEKYPYMYPCPSIQKFSYKSLFIQEWYANYLTELEPYNVSYNDIDDVTKMCAPYVNILHIKELKAPMFRKKDSPTGDAEVKLESFKWLKETCLPALPYVQRIDLSQILPHLNRLTSLAICFGFSNYERYRCFRKSRIHIKDIENLFRGIMQSENITSLRIYMSAFYETDMRVAVRCLVLLPVNLKKLEISNCELDDRAGRMIGQLIIYHLTLENINIKSNHLTNTGAYFIAVSLCMTDLKNLKYLNISQNGIGCIGAMYFGLMLTVNGHLRSLNVTACRIGKPGGLFLLACLSLNKGLKNLDLSVNHLGKLANTREEYISQIMKAHPNLVSLTLTECGLDPAFTEFIKLLGNEKRKTESKGMDQHGTVVLRIPKETNFNENWKAYTVPTLDEPSVYSTDSGELTSIGGSSTKEELEEEEENEEEIIIPKKKLLRFMHGVWNKKLALQAIKSVMIDIYKLSVLRAQRQGMTVRKCYKEAISTAPIKTLVKDEMRRVVRKKMKASKLFHKPNKTQSGMTPIPRDVFEQVLRKKLNRVPIRLVNKVLNHTFKKIQN